MNFRSVADLNNTIVRNLGRVPKDIGLVVGIPRSGMLAANMLALHLNLPMTDLDGFLERRLMQCGDRVIRNKCRGNTPYVGRVLVIDDSLDSGRSMEQARGRIAASGVSDDVVYTAVYVSLPGRGKVDLSFEEIVGHRVFEWNLMHHSLLPRACVDIDGVLCDDPTPEENDDGPRYEHFLRETTLRCVPSYRIGWLVTARLERYRRQTETWLDKHCIKYDHLVMLDLPDQAARQAANAHAGFKAAVYRSTDAALFIESSHRQAREIAANARRPVLSFETREMIYPPGLASATKAVRRVPGFLTRRMSRLSRQLKRRVLHVDPPRQSRAGQAETAPPTHDSKR